MIDGPLTVQTLVFFSYLHCYFMLQVVLCRALGHYLCEHDGKVHLKAKHKTTESTNFITQVHTVKHTICSCQDGAARRGKEEANKGQVNKLTIKMLTEQTGMRLPKTHKTKTNPKNSMRCIGVCLSCRGPVQPDNGCKNMLPGAVMGAWLWEAHVTSCVNQQKAQHQISYWRQSERIKPDRKVVPVRFHCVEDGREENLMESSDKKWRGVGDERKRGVLKPHRCFFQGGKAVELTGRRDR